jgi:hypothetical protein
MAENGQAQPIEIRVDEVSQLFNTLDPFPFHERDLYSDAEEYIVGWAREVAHQGTLSIVVHLPTVSLPGFTFATAAISIAAWPRRR